MDEKRFPSELCDQTNVRFPAGMRDELKAAAAKSGRSMNAEILARLGTAQKTLRDEFAMAALPEILRHWIEVESANTEDDEARVNAQNVSRQAYAFADAMLSVRSEGAR
ncbi:Arc family DNA-binding protein [Aureimonas ureilytica]|uniref:Arc family DNA-binding protein n=1 Tax=Aureimonas ureilytica TaxID=401562 RepID=UPI00037FEBE6|nr:Arc family DNA-binding protein [Aureimonas ureilytica]